MDKVSQLMEYITQDIIAFIVEDKLIDYEKAMEMFYTSEIYDKLLDEETGLYTQSSVYVYDLFKNECENGFLLQEEQ